MKIFGMVFALHLVLACVLVLIQGCRSTPARAPVVASAATATETTSENWSSQSSPLLAPTPVDSGYAPIAGPSLSGLTPAERSRLSPTRPDNPASFITTEVPNETAAPSSTAPATYVVRSGDSLWRIARAHGTTTAEIQKLNPSLRGDSLRPGMIVKVPGTQPAAGPATGLGSVPEPRPAGTNYVVKSGDSLSKIAARNGTTVSALREANHLRTDMIQLGQSLLIPGGVADAEASAPAVFGGAPTGSDPSSRVTIVVQRGDTLGEIARKFDVTVPDLMAANNISDPRKVRIGQTLVVPGFRPVGSGAIPRATPPPVEPSSPRTITPPRKDPPPSDLPPPVRERPAELDALPIETDMAAPPVVPIDEPVPAP